MKRVLVDRHQADLFYSLQLLFEDRLGCIVYTPIGHEWWDEGYWRFGEGYGDDRLAQQFLNTAPFGLTGEEDPIISYSRDGHHPDRRIRGVTLPIAKLWHWDYVVATVQDNQRGFKRFADEVGAKFVLQVGNTGQQIDWSLDPLALVSSEMPIHGRGVVYHQELEAKSTFRFRDLEDGTVVRSFINCFPSIGYLWATFEEAKALLPEFIFTAHGIDGPDGNVAPVTAIADLMASSGWGWHDKPQGDGFGHVIHDWAAVGRPIVGHAAHYRGLMAEGFWEDGVTCIDLGRYSVPEATRLIRDITADRPRHQEMCAEIRRRFDRIDYDAEAEMIRGFLS